uniref:(northern house mosquito) hypothetical protein n=1 Tax=Culex pipiens TaxID=7175 RepID=A0A8D8BJ73_CULPI
MGLDGVVALFAVQVLHVAHGPPKAGRVLQVWQRQRQRPLRRAGQTRHQAGVLQRDVQGRVAGRAVVRVQRGLWWPRHQVPDTAVRLVWHQEAGRQRLQGPAAASGDEGVQGTTLHLELSRVQGLVAVL